MLATERSASKPALNGSEVARTIDDNPSRSRIAQSLGSRDPAWFKQTQERGLGSAAFRRNQVEDLSDTASTTSSQRLPGMSRESTAEPEGRMSPVPESIGSNGSLGRNYRYNGSESISSSRGIGSPLPTMASQRFEPPSSDTVSSSGEDVSSTARALAMSPSQGRISPERMDRPTSPTKGLGGFVQSAMLKRSDSVSKRWSTQGGPGLSRGNSTASNMAGYGNSRYPLGVITPLAESRSNNISREGSPTSTSRPTSSHSVTLAAQRLSENDRPSSSAPLIGSSPKARSDEKSAMPVPRQSKSPTPPTEVIEAPVSPSKRWSPTKPSWLENAINKPDSPKVKSPAPQQPAWMAEINRAKQKKGSVDLSKEIKFKEVAIGGLVRSPPPRTGYKPPPFGGPTRGFNASEAMKPPNGQVDEGTTRERSSIAAKPKMSTPTVLKEPPAPSLSRDVGDTNTDQLNVLVGSEAALSSTPSALVDQKETRPISNPSPKSKPKTPPRKDFTSTLKSRQTSEDDKPKEEPEFKNVFGNLKRTQTKNYVAPDELKDNIMRGKAGLAQTGGPKRIERKDEFKESILQKKQGMVVPSASSRITSASSKSQGQSIPEAIARKGGLAQPERLQSNDETNADQQASETEALAKPQHLYDKSILSPPEKQSSPSKSLQPASAQSDTSGAFSASLAGILQRRPSPMAANAPLSSSNETREKDITVNSSDSRVSSEGPQLTHATKTRGRGPKRRLPTASKQVVSADTPQLTPNLQSKPSIIEGQPSLVTYGSKPHSSLSKSEPRALSNITHNNNNNRKPSQPLSPRKPSTSIASPSDVNKSTSPIFHGASKEASSRYSPPVKNKPVLSTNRPDARQSSPTTQSTLSDTPLQQEKAQKLQSNVSKAVREQEKGEVQLQDSDATLPSVKDAAAFWGQSSRTDQMVRARSPVKLPTRRDEEAALEEAGLKQKHPIGVHNQEPISPPTPDANLQLQNARSPKSPPRPGPKSSSIVPSTTTLSIPPESIQPSQPSGPFADIFDEEPSSKQSVTVSTQAVLDTCSSKNRSTKIKTLRKQIVEIIENGKSVPVPMHQEHILFDQSTYLCTHVFGNQAGQRTTEVYLWFGDAAPALIVEDAQLFARKHAKDNGGKLITLKQGKETTNFYQALGGIVITRRGSSNRADSITGSDGGYVLCGRQHVGQIAFDEVDYNPRSLCKGFPYIVCTQSGKLYLWKGNGSGADELGCARLIGMDLGNTGEIEEIDDGREPDAFWKAFSRSNQGQAIGTGASGQHWHLKPSCENYVTRLFSMNLETQRPKSASGFIQGAMQWGRRGSAPANDADTSKTAQIREIFPFVQSDLEDDGVFVLDSFFEIFV